MCIYIYIYMYAYIYLFIFIYINLYIYLFISSTNTHELMLRDAARIRGIGVPRATIRGAAAARIESWRLFECFAPLATPAANPRYIIRHVALTALRAVIATWRSSLYINNMAPRWHHGTIAPRALKKSKKINWGKIPQSKA